MEKAKRLEETAGPIARAIDCLDTSDHEADVMLQRLAVVVCARPLQAPSEAGFGQAALTSMDVHLCKTLQDTKGRDQEAATYA